LSWRAIALQSCWVSRAMLDRFGTCCRTSPLVLSLVPRSQAWWGVAKWKGASSHASSRPDGIERRPLGSLRAGSRVRRQGPRVTTPRDTRCVLDPASGSSTSGWLNSRPGSTGGDHSGVRFCPRPPRNAAMREAWPNQPMRSIAICSLGSSPVRSPCRRGFSVLREHRTRGARTLARERRVRSRAARVPTIGGTVPVSSSNR
jgi:hypothetical protein